MLEPFHIEKLLRISKENSDTRSIDILFDTGAPVGTTGETADAGIGSIYSNETNGDIYRKIADTNSASDWEILGAVSLDQLSWRNERVILASNDVIGVGVVDPTALSDNESGLDGNDITVGDFIIGDVDGSPTLLEVTVVTSATSVTTAAASQSIADNDTFVVQNYLPDSPGSQEGQAIIHIPVAGSPAVKIGDIDWNFADGINMATAYSSAGVNGSISSSDTVNSAIEKLEGNQDDILTALGVAQGDVDFGTFTGDHFADNQDAKQLFQRAEDLFETIQGVEVTGVSTLTTIDEVPVADVQSCLWIVDAFDEATPANKKARLVHGLNDGSSAVRSIFSRLKTGLNFNFVVDVDVSGGNMRLRASSTNPAITVRARKLEVVKTNL